MNYVLIIVLSGITWCQNYAKCAEYCIFCRGRQKIMYNRGTPAAKQVRVKRLYYKKGKMYKRGRMYYRERAFRTGFQSI